MKTFGRWNEKNSPVFVFGENHSSNIDKQFIRDAIKHIKPAIVLHELLYDYVPKRSGSVEEELQQCRIGGDCDPRLNVDIFEMAKQHGFLPIGIDTAKYLSGNPREDFPKREKAMLREIRFILSRTTLSPIVIVVGDSHLRQRRITALGGESVLTKAFKNRRFVVFRSLDREVV